MFLFIYDFRFQLAAWIMHNSKIRSSTNCHRSHRCTQSVGRWWWQVLLCNVPPESWHRLQLFCREVSSLTNPFLEFRVPHCTLQLVTYDVSLCQIGIRCLLLSIACQSCHCLMVAGAAHFVVQGTLPIALCWGWL
jgi:hypothetical protein